MVNHLSAKIGLNFQKGRDFFKDLRRFGTVLTALPRLATALRAATGLDPAFGTEGKTVMNGGAQFGQAGDIPVASAFTP